MTKWLVINEIQGLEGEIYPLAYKDRKYAFSRIDIGTIKFNKIIENESYESYDIEYEILENIDIYAEVEDLEYIIEDKTLIYEIKFDSCLITINNKKIFCEFKLTGVWVNYPEESNRDKIVIRTRGNSKIKLTNCFDS